MLFIDFAQCTAQKSFNDDILQFHGMALLRLSRLCRASQKCPTCDGRRANRSNSQCWEKGRLVTRAFSACSLEVGDSPSETRDRNPPPLLPRVRWWPEAEAGSHPCEAPPPLQTTLTCCEIGSIVQEHPVVKVPTRHTSHSGWLLY